MKVMIGKQIQLALMSAPLLLAARGTSYQPDGFTGGYSDTQLSDNVFSVTFNGNAYTDPHKASDFRMLRAADLAVQHGFRYFVIEDSANTSTTSFMGSYGAGSMGGGEMYSPRGTIRIVCFAKKGNDSRTYLDASLISNNVRSKYDIK
jgi:hypothetical protein